MKIVLNLKLMFLKIQNAYTFNLYYVVHDSWTSLDHEQMLMFMNSLWMLKRCKKLIVYVLGRGHRSLHSCNCWHNTDQSSSILVCAICRFKVLDSYYWNMTLNMQTRYALNLLLPWSNIYSKARFDLISILSYCYDLVLFKALLCYRISIFVVFGLNTKFDLLP